MSRKWECQKNVATTTPTPTLIVPWTLVAPTEVRTQQLEQLPPYPTIFFLISVGNKVKGKNPTCLWLICSVQLTASAGFEFLIVIALAGYIIGSLRTLQCSRTIYRTYIASNRYYCRTSFLNSSRIDILPTTTPNYPAWVRHRFDMAMPCRPLCHWRLTG